MERDELLKTLERQAAGLGLSMSDLREVVGRLRLTDIRILRQILDRDVIGAAGRIAGRRAPSK